jgi:hypothetical protein
MIGYALLRQRNNAIRRTRLTTLWLNMAVKVTTGIGYWDSFKEIDIILQLIDCYSRITLTIVRFF